MAPERAGAALAKLRSQQLATEAPPPDAAAAQSALKALVSCTSLAGQRVPLSDVLEEVITVSDDFPWVDATTYIDADPARRALLIDVLEGNATLPGLSALVPECEGDVLPWVRPRRESAARVCASRFTFAFTRRARVMQCGELHAAALLHLRADAFARRGDTVSMLACAEMPLVFRSGVMSRCCFHRRLLWHLSLACRKGLILGTVAAGGLEFAAQTLATFPSCRGAAVCVARYASHASGDGLERRALQTGMLPHLITFLKDSIKRADDEDEGELADSGDLTTNTDAIWAALSSAFMTLAGCSCDAKPHRASVPQPQVMEELIKAGLPRLYLSRAVALSQRMHKLARQPQEVNDLLTTGLRMVGHVFRACVLFATTPRQRDPRLLMTLVAALRANAHLDKLQLWALRYCFVPLAYAEITRKKGGNIGHAFARAGSRACRLQCCAPLRSMGNAPETLAVLHAAGALPVVLAATEQHRGCRRSAARLLAYLTQGDYSARRLLSELGAPALMLHVHVDEQPRIMPKELLDEMHQLDENHALGKMLRVAHQALRDNRFPDTDAVEPPREDGCSLSECEYDDDSFGIPTNVGSSAPFEEIMKGLQENSSWHRERMSIFTRAVCALTDAPDVKSATHARAAAAADDVMAELLAEEEAEKTARAKKKNKKKKNKGAKAIAAVEDSEASGGDEEEETAEAVGVETLVAGVTRATLAPPPPPFRSPAAAAAAQPPPPSVTKPKASKAKAKAAAPAANTELPAKAEPPPCVAVPTQAPPFSPPMTQMPMLPPLPPLLSQAALHPAPQLPPLPLARASSTIDELFPWLAQGSPPSEPAGLFADMAHEDDGLCVVCLDEQRSTALPGCADAHPPVLCAGCVALLRHGNAPACPLCRAPLN